MVQKVKCELQEVKYKIQRDLDSVGENLCMFRKKLLQTSIQNFLVIISECWDVKFYRDCFMQLFSLTFDFSR